MPTKIHTRLTFLLLAIHLVMMVIVVVGVAYFSEMYAHETSQRAGFAVAPTLAEHGKIHRVADATPQKLNALSELLRCVEPSANAFVIDDHGKILASNLTTPGVLSAVAVDPIKQLFGKEMLPIYGDDPVNGEQAVISAAALEDGYLYLTLKSVTATDLLERIGQSHALQIMGAMALLSVLVATIVGAATFLSVTDKLSRLARRMKAFRASGFSAAESLAPSAVPRDEIDELSRTFSEMARRIASQVNDLKRTDELRRELVANVSHDLRTPLTTLKGYVDTLKLKFALLTSEERDQYLDVASKSCDRVARLVDDLVELAKLEANEVTPHMEPFPIDHPPSRRADLSAQQNRRGHDLWIQSAWRVRT